MNIFKLFASIVLSTESYKKGMADVKKENQVFEQESQKTSKSVGIGWAAVVAVIIKLAQQIGKLIVSTAAYGSEITSLSNKLGLSKQAVQEWSYVAQQNGTTVESLSTAMRTLTAAAESNDEKLTSLIGTTKQANGQYKTQEQLLRETLNALSQIPDKTERAAKSQDVFGRSAQELGEILNLTTSEIDAMIQEAHSLGIVLGDEVVAAADNMDDKLAGLKMMRKAAFAELIFGDPEEGARILNEYVKKMEELAPQFVNAGLKIAGAVTGAILKEFAIPLVLAAAGFAFMGPVGAILGMIAGLGIKSGITALGNAFGGGNNENSASDSIVNASSSMSNAYSSSTTVTQTVDVNIIASGNSPVSEQSAVTVGQALLDMINQVQVTI